MNFYGFPGSHKAMGSIHLSTVTKLHHGLWPDVAFRWFKGSLTLLTPSLHIQLPPGEKGEYTSTLTSSYAGL